MLGGPLARISAHAVSHEVSFLARVLLANLTDLAGRQYPPLTGLPPSSSSDNDK